MLALGVDATRTGWVAIALEDGRFAASALEPSFEDLLARFPHAAAIGVDIPIGLPEEGRRECDVLARLALGPRRNSVFLTPPRRALETESYAEARRVWPSLSAQAFALRAKILEVEGHTADERILEVHPEVTFLALARGRHLPFAKRTWNGQLARRRLLGRAGIRLPDTLDAGLAPADDVLDAAAAAWSADRYARGEAVPLPEGATERVGAIWR
jgi:predicted RNase H-like nuclease